MTTTKKVTRVSEWMDSLPDQNGIRIISEDLPFDHPEDEYDKQYGDQDIEKTIGTFVLDAAGFIPTSLMEVACGTGHMTASLLYDGRVEEIVASDASAAFLEITKKKVASLGRDLGLVLLSDQDFDRIPAGVFDAIVMRSALHHFVDFKGVAATLLGKLKPGGGLFMLEPRADFHIASSLILKAVQVKASQVEWTEMHTQQTQGFIDAADFYLNRTLDKAEAEDKYVFHMEEFLDIAEANNASFRVLGSEYPSTFTVAFHDFMKYCHRFEPQVLEDVMTLAQDELAFMDRALATRTRYSAAEWFLFRK